MTISLRPQPIGFFPFPAGLLLLPPAANSDAALKSLLNGAIPASYPPEWRFFILALNNQREAALDLLTDNSPLTTYNRFVLTGQLPTNSDPLTQAVAYTLGLSENPPPVTGLDAELSAILGMTAAAHALEIENPAAAESFLTAAINAAREASPLLAAHLLDQRAQLRHPRQAIQDWQAALRLAAASELPGFLAHLHLSLGTALHEFGHHQEAAKHYQHALTTGYSLEQNPEMFAWTQQQLALAYLAMPLHSASDQLRMAIAVQSLREALKVYTKETHLELWTSAQLNLANALQYLPSAHPKENLMQAVEIYEQLLPLRNRAFDPLGYARLLFNQANALAHLGIFQPALEKLNEAHKLFHWHGEEKLAAGALEQVAQINEKLVVVS